MWSLTFAGCLFTRFLRGSCTQASDPLFRDLILGACFLDESMAVRQFDSMESEVWCMDGGSIHTQASRHFDLHPQAGHNHVTRSISSQDSRELSEGQQLLETAPHPGSHSKIWTSALPPWNPEIHTHGGGSQGHRAGTLVHIWTCTPERGESGTHTFPVLTG